jgi:hypothetical protein
MTLVQSLRVAGGHYAKPNIYDDAADRINELEAAVLRFCELEAENKRLREQLATELVYGPDRSQSDAGAAK